MTMLFTEPRTPASVEFAELVARRDDAARRVDELEATQRRASADAASAAEAVADVERRMIHGEQIADAERKRREQALTKAQMRRAEPWAERIQGARRAVAECERAIVAFAGERYAELMAELEEDARAAAERVNVALHDLCVAYEARQQEDQRVHGLVALASGGRVRPGMVAPSAVETIASQCAAVIAGGGERPPLMKIDPRAAQPEVAA